LKITKLLLINNYKSSHSQLVLYWLFGGYTGNEIFITATKPRIAQKLAFFFAAMIIFFL